MILTPPATGNVQSVRSYGLRCVRLEIVPDDLAATVTPGGEG